MDRRSTLIGKLLGLVAAHNRRRERLRSAHCGEFTSMVKEIDAFLMGESKVHTTLERIARRLDELNIGFALAGGLAVGLRGHLRLTVDVDVLSRAEDLERFKERWLGRGYVEKFAGSRGVKDTQSGVSIDFLIAGHYPGDGRPKPVRFPEPLSIPLGNSCEAC